MTRKYFYLIDQGRSKVLPVLLLTAMCLFLLVISGCMSTDQSPLLSVHLIDVGQGDSQLIVTPQKSVILIDAGDSLQGDRIVAYLKRHDIKRVDHFILTHPHSDHIGGASAILEQLQVSKVYLPPVLHTSQLYEKILNYLTIHKIPTAIVKESSSILKEDLLEIKILSASQNFDRDLNNWSLITHIRHQSQGFLFMGDAEAEAEEALLSSVHPAQLKSNVLKAGHHGSRNSTSDAFLEVVMPETVLISCGEDNSYYHPHLELIQRLEKHDVLFYRTDLQGSVVLYSDGSKIFSHQQPLNH